MSLTTPVMCDTNGATFALTRFDLPSAGYKRTRMFLVLLFVICRGCCFAYVPHSWKQIAWNVFAERAWCTIVSFADKLFAASLLNASTSGRNIGFCCTACRTTSAIIIDLPEPAPAINAKFDLRSAMWAITASCSAVKLAGGADGGTVGIGEFKHPRWTHVPVCGLRTMCSLTLIATPHVHVLGKRASMYSNEPSDDPSSESALSQSSSDGNATVGVGAVETGAFPGGVFDAALLAAVLLAVVLVGVAVPSVASRTRLGGPCSDI
mmetsp:Transcript_80369/g.228845  ORF Transcript_80369/g.228845 Transcript_80369/m.228845 type:complete len:265 (+) Transcript_80369:349-1143(+)